MMWVPATASPQSNDGSNCRLHAFLQHLGSAGGFVMKSVSIARAVVFAGALAFAGSASAASLSVGVGVHGDHDHDRDNGPVVIEHDHPRPPVVVEHRSATDCSSKKVVVHHGNGDTSTHTRTDCD
jgi:hypothetical protein